MRYFGGKSRIAKQVAAVINADRGDALLWDPFCGGLATAAALGGRLLCSDIHPGLIALYRTLQQDPTFLDWLPDEISPEEYAWVKARARPDSALDAFIGFGCSFRGMWFRGHVRPTCPNGAGVWYHAIPQARRRVLADVRACAGARFDVIDFLAMPVGRLCPGFLYLDPPYRGTEGYTIAPDFDHDAFAGRVDDWARAGARVYVSEYSFPLGEVVWQAERRKSGASRAGVQPFERLYRIG